MTMHKPLIRSLTLKRFRSVPAATIDFDNPTFLVGRNGAGKSNVIDAFAFLSEAMSVPLQAVFDKRGGIAAVRNRSSGKSHPPNIALGISLGAVNGSVKSAYYAFEVKALKSYGYKVIREQCLVRTAHGPQTWFDRQDGKFRSNVKGLDPSVDPAALVMPIVGGDTRFAPVVRTLGAMRVNSIVPSRLRDMQDPDSGTSLRSDGSNAASVLQEIERNSEDDLSMICETLNTIVPNTTNVRTKKHGNKLSLEFTQEWGENKSVTFDAFSMSDGTLRALGLLAAVYQRPSPSLLALEEPEATIHPGALGSVLDRLRHAARSMQVVVTTHSPEVLDADWIGDKHLRVVEWTEGATRVAPVSESTRAALQQHVMGAGELLRSNALEARPVFKDELELVYRPLFEDFDS